MPAHCRKSEMSNCLVQAKQLQDTLGSSWESLLSLD